MKTPQLKEGTERIIERFLAEKLRKIGAKGFAVGVSGGIDSAVVLKLAVRAVGKEKVLGILMPERDSPKDDVRDAEDLCKAEGVKHRTIDITKIVDEYASVLEKADKKALANVKARCRMTILYHYAGAESRLVLGTSNKSELLVGYFTKFGDGGADLEPIGDLYKTEVRQLAEKLGVPEGIRKKAPSAGLWKGQTDEKEMGITYERLDSILHGIELGQSDKTIAENAETTVKEVLRIERTIRLSSHKRKLPPVVKVGIRTPGLDWREGDEDL
ncbi:MAG: NAD+ synthase [Candidatus Thermoplasmatota archaeon]|nr:NAD+ synthase [Candidatus Thermoplasmatota archaeon]